jgi:hypothetical protein
MARFMSASLPGGGVALLSVDADVAEFAAVGLDELLRLHEHAPLPQQGS